jgi:hypothetical protein
VIRIYQHPVIRVPLQGLWLLDAERFAKSYVEKKEKPFLRNWIETWYLCTRAFLWYYDALEEWGRIEQKALNTGWTPLETLRINKHTFYVTTSAARDAKGLGSDLEGRIPRKAFDRSHGTHFVLTNLVVPDVDIVGWFPRDAVSGYLRDWTYFLPERDCLSMRDIPGLPSRDKRLSYG